MVPTYRFGERDVYSPGQVARIVGVHRNTVRAWCRSGRIECLRTPGGHYRITDAALAKLACTPRPLAESKPTANAA